MDFSMLTIDTPLELINTAMQNSLIGNLQIRIEAIARGEVRASMPVCPQTTRPDGILHGGSNLALAETIAGLGSMLVIDMSEFDIRGIHVTGSHTGTVRDGFVLATAKIIHQGNQTHVWNVDVTNKDGRLVSTIRVTNMIVKRNE
ncbi:PaaI family thioesterase [Gaoshiqia sp. Z1-71]|uniref:PaaI family thioesterase n=1 Tax=Gaoshiqia hydrogeniformans TaxID=3290090 RepID=UPI003BF7AA91